jgi:plastocyanin
MVSKRALALVAGVLGAAAIAVPAGASTADKGTKVAITGDSISDYAFSPSKVTVGEGEKVTWKWSSNAPHNVTFKKLGEASDDGASGTYKLKFADAGTYKYVCTIHGFKGKVVVD